MLYNNLTFAVLLSDSAWHTDLTVRFCEYFSNKINGPGFLDRVIYPESVDDAIHKCQTDYLLIQMGGHITFNDAFFNALEKAAFEASDIAIGHLLLEDDYIKIDKRCIFINMILWRAYGKPAYVSRIKEGPSFKVSSPTKEKSKPNEVILDDTKDRAFVPGYCGIVGGGIIVKQLDTFKKATSLTGITEEQDSFFLDARTPYHEIHTESIFEKKYLAPFRKKIFGLERDDMSSIKATLAEIVVAPAQGLKALTLAETFKASKIIVYDYNPLALELQKKILSVQIPMTYGEIVEDFIKQFPQAVFMDEWSQDTHDVVKPLKNVEVEYRLVDLFSFQAEELVQSIDDVKSMVFDLSDIFTYPYNFYHKPLYQAQGLFGEFYSLLKSRRGGTFILGLAPGFQNLNSIEINTSRKQFEYIAPPPPEDSNEEIPVPDIMWIPPVATKKLEELVYVPPVKVVDKIVELRKPTTPICAAKEMGYMKSSRPHKLSQEYSLTILTKYEDFEDFPAIFEYAIDEVLGSWKFQVGKKGSDKKVEFSNGLTMEGMLKHLLTEMKINPKTAAKYFE